MPDREDYYQILGVALDASPEDIKQAFRKKALDYHPDRLGGVSESVRCLAEEEMKKINQAYEVLKDPHKRRQYDSKWTIPKPIREKVRPKRTPAARPTPQPSPGFPIIGKWILGAVSIVAIIALLSTSFIIKTSGSIHNLTKDCYYNTIQEAINDADNDNTIEVNDGTYKENVDVNKDYLTIISKNGAEVTFVQAVNSGDHVFDIRADYVNINGFTVTGAKIWKNEEPASGIYLQEANYCTIVKNNALNDYFGIFLKHSNNCKITNNNVSGNTSGCGIYLIYSKDNIIASNTISNKLQGIFLESSNNNNLINNTANSNTHYGICLYSSNDNKVTKNTTIGNGTVGIHSCHSSTNNIIYLNNE